MAVNNSINTGALSAGQVKVDGAGNLSTSALTQYDVLVGGTSNAIVSVGPGTAGQALLSGGNAANPSYVTPAAGTGLTVTTNASTLSYALQTPVTVANGGTGAATFTAHSLLVGEGTSALVALGAATNGQLPIGSTGADPVLATITAGTGITVSNGAGSITVSASGAGAFTWTDVTGTSASMAVNNGYIADNAGLVTLTLPATAAVGDIIRVTGKGAGGWTVAQNAGQTIFFGSSATTTGATGTLSSTNRRDGFLIVCVTTNNDFNVLSAQGNLTVV